MGFSQQVAVITGAASGIGLALAQVCLEQGIHIVMADNAVTALCDKVEQLNDRAGVEVLGMVCDVAKPDNSTPLHSDKLHHMVVDLIARSRPALDVAEYIVREVQNKAFYILPDQEVKDYCEQRTKAIVGQDKPHKHSLEKIIASLSERAGVERSS